MLVITNVDPATPISVAFEVMQAEFHPTLTHLDNMRVKCLFPRTVAGVSLPILA